MNIVDFHTHIIPKADHGSSSIETSLFQVNEALANGVSRIIATPHFYPTSHKMETFLQRRNEGYLQLREALGDSPVQIKLGAEVLFCDSIEELPNLEKLFIEGTNSLLLELPFSTFAESYTDSVYALKKRGVDVILAHADRYPTEHIEKLVEYGARLQLNADSLVGFFKRKSLYKWLERGLVIALGSDIHGNDRTAYQCFTKASMKIDHYLPYIKRESDKIFDKATFI